MNICFVYQFAKKSLQGPQSHVQIVFEAESNWPQHSLDFFIFCHFTTSQNIPCDEKNFVSKAQEKQGGGMEEVIYIYIFFFSFSFFNLM